jgi:hypothetical protein
MKTIFHPGQILARNVEGKAAGMPTAEKNGVILGLSTSPEVLRDGSVTVNLDTELTDLSNLLIQDGER